MNTHESYHQDFQAKGERGEGSETTQSFHLFSEVIIIVIRIIMMIIIFILLIIMVMG